jgi:hypothetical protein
VQHARGDNLEAVLLESGINLPIRFFATASGLMIESVRSTAMLKISAKQNDKILNNWKF